MTGAQPPDPCFVTTTKASPDSHQQSRKATGSRLREELVGSGALLRGTTPDVRSRSTEAPGVEADGCLAPSEAASLRRRIDGKV
jgi:hypothetical protein